MMNFTPKQIGPQQTSKFLSQPLEQPLAIRQSRKWSRLILWSLMTISVGSVIWAANARLEEAVAARGKLEPAGSTKEIQVPLNGVISEVHVEEGELVRKGQLLITIDQATTQAELASLEKVKAALQQENAFYRSQLNGQAIGSTIGIPAQMLSLTRSRSALLSANRLAQAQLDGDFSRVNLTPEQVAQARSEAAESQSRAAAAQLEVGQLREQVRLVQVRLAAAEKSFTTNQEIYDRLTPLANAGGIGKIQHIQQEQKVEEARSQVQQLTQEIARLQLSIQQAQARSVNTTDVDRKDLTQRIATNLQQIAQIDSQMTKAIVDNDKRIAEIDSQIKQNNQRLAYTKVVAPVDGKIFDLKPYGKGFVANSAEPILKIVPQEDLVAKVSITNQDIGFIRTGMPVDIRIDTFPFGQYGDIKGELIWIGDDALPPTQLQPNYTFPAKVKLDRQSLPLGERQIPLQAGMSISANVKVRDRTVLSFFTDAITRTAESLKFVR